MLDWDEKIECDACHIIRTGASFGNGTINIVTAEITYRVNVKTGKPVLEGISRSLFTVRNKKTNRDKAIEIAKIFMDADAGPIVVIDRLTEAGLLKED
ncbi:MAG: hypothetical protein V3V40_06465 [Nitrosomonadaceae bacterium]